LSCVGEVSIVTQLNSTDLLRADWPYAATGSVALPIAGDCRSLCLRSQLSCVGKGVYSNATQLNSTSSWVSLSYVAINEL